MGVLFKVCVSFWLFTVSWGERGAWDEMAVAFNEMAIAGD
jgi:hypothetical protein